MRLNHNMNSLNCFNRYKKNIKQNSIAMNKITTGMQINSAKDNPNKIGQSEQMRIQLKSLKSAQRSVQDATSMLQSADGALGEANSILARMKELAVQASNDINNVIDRQAMQDEMKQLQNNLFDLANNTEFNGVKLIGEKEIINNNYPLHLTTVVGAEVDEISNIPIFNISPEVLKAEDGTKLSEIDIFTSSETATKAIKVIDEAILTVSNIRTKYGAMSNRFDSTYDSLEEIYNSVTKAESNIRDADIAKEIIEVSRTELLTNASIGLIAQANQIPLDSLRILERTR